MSWIQKEKAIREKRTLEATKKNFMGVSGKMGVIAQTLGSPIIQQGGGLFDVNYLEDPDDFTEAEYETTASGQPGPQMYRDELPESTDSSVEERGYVFDGLSRGMHIEIRFWHDGQRIEVNYKGYLVYREIASELLAYAPFPEWESMVERLYKLAKQKTMSVKEATQMALATKIQREKENFWARLRHRWGV